MPLRNHEQILVFYKRLPTYNPQKFRYKSARFKIGQESRITESVKRPTHDVYGKVPLRVPWRETGMRYPLSVVWCSSKERSSDNVHITRKVHPTQKPVLLYEYLVKTYTDTRETVLDFTMGSGTTGVACVQTGRRFIGIEIDEGYFEIAKQRIIEAQMQPRLEGM